MLFVSVTVGLAMQDLRVQLAFCQQRRRLIRTDASLSYNVISHHHHRHHLVFFHHNSRLDTSASLAADAAAGTYTRVITELVTYRVVSYYFI